MNENNEMNTGADKKLWKLINYCGGAWEVQGIKICRIERGLTITRDCWAIEVTLQDDTKFKMVWGHSSDSSVRTSQGKDVDAIICFDGKSLTYEGNDKLAEIFSRCLPGYGDHYGEEIKRGIPDQVWKALQMVKDETWIDNLDEYSLIDVLRGRIKASDKDKEKAKANLTEYVNKHPEEREFIEGYTSKLE